MIISPCAGVSGVRHLVDNVVDGLKYKCEMTGSLLRKPKLPRDERIPLENSATIRLAGLD